MSRYLFDRIEASANIELICQAEVVALDGDPRMGLERITWRDRTADRTHEEAIANLFQAKAPTSACLRIVIETLVQEEMMWRVIREEG